MGLFKTGIKRKIWIPLYKTEKGEYRGILSDTSMDRDSELMSKKLIQKWAENKSLPALIDHENKMKSWVGGWSDFKTISKGKNNALTAKYKFFSKTANPEAFRVKKQIDEAIDMGLNPGISIGAVPKKYIEVERNGKTYRMWTKAELVEASFVPIQSNKNSYAYVAKSFLCPKNGTETNKDLIIGLEKPAKLDRCVRELMADPKFKPKKGRTKEESAYAVCQAAMKDGISTREVIRKMDKKTKVLPSSIKKEYLQKFYPTKKAVREVFDKLFEAAVEKQLEEKGKEWRIKCNKFVLDKLRKEIIVKKGFTEPMIIKDTEDGEVEPSMTNMARAMSGLKLRKTKKPKGGN